MKNYDILLFDLDGTLTDPGLGITNSIMYALEKMGSPIPEREALYRFIGPPLTWTFGNFFGFTEEDTFKAIKFYREHFSVTGLYENEVYPGVPEMLKKLRDSGKTLAVATSKPEKFAVEILRHFGMAEYFHHICGAAFDETRGTKHEVIEYALGRLGNPERGDVLMIGDREHDIIGAKASGLGSLGVLYGYGDRAEHESAGADYIVESVEALQKALLG
ncbi:MAG: HAD family hydrolase [Oscillospiraceae bacterium]|nr:HAD family hydrolase [Oscillospiraceae bacterium]